MLNKKIIITNLIILIFCIFIANTIASITNSNYNSNNEQTQLIDYMNSQLSKEIKTELLIKQTQSIVQKTQQDINEHAYPICNG